MTKGEQEIKELMQLQIDLLKETVAVQERTIAAQKVIISALNGSLEVKRNLSLITN